MTASRRLIVICLLPALSLGCEALRKSPKVDNPVVGPPPIRTSYVEVDPPGTAQLADAEGAESGVTLTSGESTVITDDMIVATVNAEPILAGDILASFQGGFATAEKDMRKRALETGRWSEEEVEEAIETQLNNIKKDLIRQHLDRHLERKLLTQALKNTMDAERIEAMEGALDEVWKEEIVRLQKKANVNSRIELEPVLKEQGMSLEAIEEMFRNQQMAMAYLHTGPTTPEVSIGRAEIVDFYREHIEEYTLPKRARWQQIEIRFSEAGGRSAAMAQVRKAVGELQQGRSFAEVAKDYSHGPRADRGGQYDWTKPGSLSNDQVDRAIFEVPVGGVSEVLEDDRAFRMVRVTERDEGGPKSLAEVQEEIRGRLQEEAKKAQTEGVIDDLMADAVIESRLH